MVGAQPYAVGDERLYFVARAGADFVTLGMAPLAGAVPRPLRVARRLSPAVLDPVREHRAIHPDPSTRR